VRGSKLCVSDEGYAHLGGEKLAAGIAGRAHPVDLLLHRADDLLLARQREAPSSVVNTIGTP
jgi:hypothetical protein